jgi:hypothetical protein
MFRIISKIIMEIEMKHFRNICLIKLLVFILFACGDPEVSITNSNFEEKIVVEGYLYPGEPINNIKLTRNFALNQSVDPSQVILTPSQNSVSIRINDVSLDYDVQTGTYFTNHFIPDYKTTYKLEVNATIDGKELYTSCTTVTPAKGFNVVNRDLGIIKYREIEPIIEFNPSPGTDFYAFSYRAENASVENFIYDNPYLPDLKPEDIEDEFDAFLYQLDLMINVDSYGVETIKHKLSGLDMWFYSEYSVIVYAGDQNFRDYTLTVKNVQEPDGNFVEPEFYFEGDGIGIFGSAIREEVRFTLVK